MIALAIIIAAASVGVVAVIALAPIFICRETEREACDAEKSPDDGPICAWCFPGRDHPAGHGICKCRAAEFLRTARENQMEDGA